MEIKKTAKEPESQKGTFDYWQQTADYALKQYKLAMMWARSESNYSWVKNYNQMWSKTYKIYGEELMPQYTRAWQNIWEGFSIDSFKEFNELCKKIIIDYTESTSEIHHETKEKLANDWIGTWLSK
ncbi:hypothetical protein [Nitrosopumilus sp.]|uniref:hypothetical protein n=1 Tax=Nitrosopumilus sp. TaxID=2024843 RepID=UPI002930B1C8|nr:hypothetical protein [Nitrosopumilus sp.]